MILAIDIGNTNIVIGCIERRGERDKILFEARLATDHVKTSDQYSIELMNILLLFKVSPDDIEGSIISSVVPPVYNAIRTAVIKITGTRPLVVGPGIKTGLNIRMDTPSQVGADLIVAAVAALAEHEPPMIIVDMGTAITLSVIGEGNTFLGGCIFPGVRVSMDALTSHAAQLPGISLDKPKRVIGKNSIDSMRSGIMYGTAAMIDGMIERMEDEYGQPFKVLATGGIAQFIIPLCRRELIYDRDLLLKGLAILYRNNTKAK
jgi:type III pantothenate kinase